MGDFFVALSGSDDNPGTRERPFRSLAAAQVAVRSSAVRGTVPITVNVQGGTYYLARPLVFTPVDSGTSAPVTWRGGAGEEPRRPR